VGSGATQREEERVGVPVVHGERGAGVRRPLRASGGAGSRPGGAAA
jgi:hypothetical protein